MTQPTATLLAGALDLLMRHSLTGCGQAAHRAASLLERLSVRPDVDSDTRRLCERMGEALAVGMEAPRASERARRLDLADSCPANSGM